MARRVNSFFPREKGTESGLGSAEEVGQEESMEDMAKRLTDAIEQYIDSLVAEENENRLSR